MKNLSEETLAFILLLILMITTLVLGFGIDAYSKSYSKYLDNYNTQQDRQMFLKSYEIVLECRKNASLVSIDKVCGTVPTFVNEVK